MDIIDVAKICHEANKSLCESLGDESQRSWIDAPQWQRDSAVEGVKYKLKNPDATPEDMHNSWCKQKIEDGWVYGPEKIPVAKLHPCLVEYGQLPAEQQAKDHLFAGIVTGLSKFID